MDRCKHCDAPIRLVRQQRGDKVRRVPMQPREDVPHVCEEKLRKRRSRRPRK